jgi:hypothetical protein
VLRGDFLNGAEGLRVRWGFCEGDQKEDDEGAGVVNSSEILNQLWLFLSGFQLGLTRDRASSARNEGRLWQHGGKMCLGIVVAQERSDKAEEPWERRCSTQGKAAARLSCRL